MTQPPPTRSDRLRAHYDDLASGRFAVVADFEDDSHLELFHLSGDDDGSSVAITADGVPPTGERCLSARFRLDGVHLVANNRAARTWLLKRDWRPYTLLIMNVFSPLENLQLTVELVGGRATRPATIQSHWTLHQGWNELRLDLGEAGQYIPLDVVREVRWSLPHADVPVTLRIDDVLLTDNRELVFGADDAPDGSLYVRREGRRISVGAAGRFELGFAQGQVVRWYALDEDPTRTRDLLGPGNTLGPMPVQLPAGDDWKSDADWRWMLGRERVPAEVAARQRVVEATAVRIVVECIWSQPGARGDDAADALTRWLYVIYPSGQVYVTIAQDASAAALAGDRVGMAVSRRPLAGMETLLHQPGRLGDRPVLAERSYACLSAQAAGADLFFMLHEGACGPRVRAVRAADTPRVNLVFFGGEPACAARHVYALMALWPVGSCTEDTSAALARSYGVQEHLEVIVGEWDRTSSGDADGDGYNERFGAYVLAPEAGSVQLRVRAAGAPLMSPVFAVAAAPDEQAWVYVDHVTHNPVTRDGQGHLIFQIPGWITRDTLVEVYLR